MNWKSDPVAAEEQCRRALAVDPLSDIAYTQLAQLLLHQNKVGDAIASYEKAVEVSRTEAEVANAISCREAAVAQLHVMTSHPEVAAMLRQGKP
jgi:mitochondrial import receptor subunit TOM70